LIIIDTREHDEKIKAYLIQNNIEIKEEMLEVGDYLICGNDLSILIERKTWSDFITSLYSGRLREQIDNLKGMENVEKLLVLEGSFWLTKKFHKKINVEGVYGMLNTIWLYDKIPIIHSPNSYTTAVILANLEKKICGKLKKIERIPHVSKTKKESDADKIIYILTSFPFINLKRAKKIMEKYENFKDFVNNVNRLDEIDGFGEKIKEKIEKIVSFKWKLN
jgi:ERCC4-type nuclease